MSDTKTKTADLAQMLTGSIDAITAMFGAMSDVEIAMLQAMEEEAEKPRSGLISAIEGVQSDRAGAAAAEHQTAIDNAVSEANKAAAERVRVLEAENADLAKKLSKAEAKTGKPKAPKVAKVKRFKPELDPDASAEAARTVVFANREGVVSEELPALTFQTRDLSSGANGPVLNRDIEFDGTGPLMEIASAWLMNDDGKAVGVARIPVPLMVGGGRKALLTKRSLLFKPAPKAATQTETA